MNVFSVFRGITTPSNQLYEQIANHGWKPGKVKWDNKLGQFTAEASNDHGEKIIKSGPDDKTALGNLLVAIVRHTHMRTAAQYKLGMWKTMFTDQLKPIAEAYAKAPAYDPKAAGYFKELADDSVRRAEVLKQQLHIEITDNPEPYANAQEMAKDIHEKQHFFVSRANSEHPIWTVDQNVAFRIVHDVLGHAVSGGDFGWQGENLACAAHFPLLTPTAQLALFTECIAQTAYTVYYRAYGPQKVALFPEFTDPPQAAENAPGHSGIHPQNVVAPVGMPKTEPSTDEDEVSPYPKGFGLQPHVEQAIYQTAPGGLFSKKYASVFADPNQGWSSGLQPMQLESHGVGNAYLDHGDPLESSEVMNNASLVDTKWHSLTGGDGKPDRARMKQAIVNAFRVVLLSPRKDLRWNAIHYQDIAGVPADVDDPKAYWDTLEAKRRQWNSAQGIDPSAHMIFYKFVKPFESIIYQMHPELGFEGAKKQAEDTLFAWWSEEQERIEAEDSEKPAEKQRSMDEIERRANEALAKRMQAYIKDKTNKKTDVYDAQPQQLFASADDNYIDDLAEKILNECSEQEIPDGYSHDQVMTLFREYALMALTKGKKTTMEDVHDAWAAWMAEHDGDHKSIKPFDELTDEVKEYDRPYMEYIHKHAAMGDQYNLMTGQPTLKYGAFMGTHLKAISKVSQHADELLDAALEDVHDHDATGHHFRSAVLNLGVSGVGPKVCSFAWLLLQPMTSQLATIDTHMMDVLGHHYEKEMNNRDYFKFERELAAGRDASGYGHVPLGAFQWGMWDHKRTGPGSHQDHSAMRVLDPVPHQDIDWAAKVQPVGVGADTFKADWKDNAPDWWRNTEDARNAVGEHWDKYIAPQVSRNKIPYQVLADQRAAQRLAWFGRDQDQDQWKMREPKLNKSVSAEREHLWDIAYRADHSPYDMQHNPAKYTDPTAPVFIPGRRGWRPQGHDQVLRENLLMGYWPPSQIRGKEWPVELENQWQKDFQERKRQEFLTNPDTMSHEYENWLNWYGQHAPEHFDPDGTAANSEHWAAQRLAWGFGQKPEQPEQYFADPMNKWMYNVLDAAHQHGADPYEIYKSKSGLIPHGEPGQWSVLNYDGRLRNRLQEPEFHQNYQALKRQRFETDPDVMSHEYEDWTNWYGQHFPQHFDPDGTAANAEHWTAATQHFGIGTYRHPYPPKVNPVDFDIQEGTTTPENSVHYGLPNQERYGNRPFVIPDYSDTLYLGQPGTHHDDLYKEFNLRPGLIRNRSSGYIEPDGNFIHYGGGLDRERTERSLNNYWGNQPQQGTFSKFAKSGESTDEFHVGIGLPERIIVQCSEIASELGLKDPEDPADYHITAFWSEHGYEDETLHDWIRSSSISGFRFENARIDCFPSHKDNWAIVLRLDSPEAKKHITELMDEADDRGLEIKRFDGGWKAHITLGYQDEKIEKQSFPDLTFRAEGLYVSIPRPLRTAALKTYEEIKNTPAFELPGPWIKHPDGETDVGVPGETAMQFARLNYPDLSTPEIWKLLGEEGAGKNGVPEGDRSATGWDLEHAQV